MAYKFLLPLALLAAALPVQAKMYKWVDAQGKVHYSDTLPPDSAGQGNMEIKKDGQAVKRSESVGEKKARLEREAEAAKLKKTAEEQARRDRALLSTYTTEKEVDLARDRALEHHNLVIKSAQVRLDPLMRQANGLTATMRRDAAAGKKSPQYAQQQYQSVMGEVEQLQNTIKTNQEAMVAVRARYDADKQRFLELTGKAAPAAPAPKPAATAPVPAPKPAVPAPAPKPSAAKP